MLDFVSLDTGYLVKDNARKDFSLSGTNPMTNARNYNCQQEKTSARCTAVQVKQVLLTELLVTAESVDIMIKGIFACHAICRPQGCWDTEELLQLS